MSSNCAFDPNANEAARRWVELEEKYGLRATKKKSARVEMAIWCADRRSRPYTGMPKEDEKPRSIHAVGQIWNRFDLFDR